MDTWHEAHVEVGGQLSQVGSLSHYVGAGDRTQVIKLTQQALLPTKPSHWPLLLSIDRLIGDGDRAEAFQCSTT